MNKQLTSSCTQLIMSLSISRARTAKQPMNGFRFLLLWLLMSMSASVFAQNSRGKDFWLMFNDNTEGGTPTLSLFITSSVNTSGVVEMAGLGYTQPFTVTANTVTTVVLPNTALIK